MKQAFLFLILTVTASQLRAQNAKQMAQEFLQRYTELADGSYKQANKEKLTTENGYARYDVTPIAGTDRTEMNAAPSQLEYTITVNRSNPKCKNFAKEMVKALEIIAKQKGWLCITRDVERTYVYNGAEEVMEYSHEEEGYIEPTIYAAVSIVAPLPYSVYLANESSYPTGFPAKPTPSKAPQAIEIKDAANNRSFIMNGQFVNNKLVSGAMRIKGYHQFMDGTWLCRNWSYEDDKLNAVSFVPETTKDTITGYVYGLNVSTFSIDLRYYDGLKATRNAPPWVQNQYVPFDKERSDKAQKEYEAKENLSHSSTSDAQRQSYYFRDAGQQSATQSGGGATSTYSSYSKCSVCNGYGYTEYDCGQGGGHPCRRTCTACNGMGQVHN